MSNCVFCSTTGAGNQSAFVVAEKLITAGIVNIELSGGIFVEDVERKILNLNNRVQKLIIHNYFPIPKKSFVINLASYNEVILSQSIDFLKRSIDVSSSLKSKIFAVHSGFLIDPLPHELGSVLDHSVIQDREKSLQIFRNSLVELSDYANEKAVSLLIENNVISKPNFEKHNQDIFLLTTPYEIKDFFSALPKEIGLLVDTGHLKVSANVHGFDFGDALVNLKDFARGYHFSENLGDTDDHLPFSIHEWEWRDLVKKNLDYYSLEFKTFDYENIKKIVEEFNSFLN